MKFRKLRYGLPLFIPVVVFRPDPSRNDTGARTSIPSPSPHPGQIPAAPVPGKWAGSGSYGAGAEFGKYSGWARAKVPILAFPALRKCSGPGSDTYLECMKAFHECI